MVVSIFVPPGAMDHSIALGQPSSTNLYILMKNFIHLLTGGRRGGFGGRGMPRHFEEVPRLQARHGEPLYDDHEYVPVVANRGRDQGYQTLDQMKCKLSSFKGENEPNIFLD
ncbi:hypothetical protein M9H77_28415 [Catharanthus roseus]|uniref:Uncharacterized protein n=1 Tax=Catharanthus roseus TaxID=4058 RepID=A0ACC0AFA1_CATRO|nr:hypothetical protein M9H77_28415 [Catharanthus roseus]